MRNGASLILKLSNASLYHQRENQNNRRGGGCGGHYGVACRAGHRISVSTIKEAANCGGPGDSLGGFSRITFRAGGTRGSRGSGRTRHTVFTGWTGRPRWSRWTLETSRESDGSHAQNEEGFNSHFDLQYCKGKSDACQLGWKVKLRRASKRPPPTSGTGPLCPSSRQKGPTAMSERGHSCQPAVNHSATFAELDGPPAVNSSLSCNPEAQKAPGSCVLSKCSERGRQLRRPWDRVMHPVIKRWLLGAAVAIAVFVAWFSLKVLTYVDDPILDRVLLRVSR